MKFNQFIKVIVSSLSFSFIVLLFLVCIVLENTVQPVLRGFYCDDQSIRYPLVSQTIPDWALALVILLVLPFVCLCGTALDLFHKLYCNASRTTCTHCSNRFKCRSLLMPLYWFVWYLMGLAFTHSLTAIFKLSTGELRPHFLAACSPAWSQVNCTDQFGLPIYVTNFTCYGNERAVRQARLSFPSGHASNAAFSTIFTAFYLSSVSAGYSRSPLHFILIVLFGILFPNLVAITRINDYYHHVHDVVFGGLLGTLIAVIVVYYFLYYFNRLKDDSFFGTKSEDKVINNEDNPEASIEASNDKKNEHTQLELTEQ